VDEERRRCETGRDWPAGGGCAPPPRYDLAGHRCWRRCISRSRWRSGESRTRIRRADGSPVVRIHEGRLLPCTVFMHCSAACSRINPCLIRPGSVVVMRSAQESWPVSRPLPWRVWSSSSNAHPLDAEGVRHQCHNTHTGLRRAKCQFQHREDRLQSATTEVESSISFWKHRSILMPMNLRGMR
jgi:hypothetical protein